MGLAILIVGLALFIATHLLVGFRGLRAGLILELGKPVYHILFSVALYLALGFLVHPYVIGVHVFG